ncbi:hypothetical protein B0H10DRAFT_978311 [Mycena sp. CBHHK59/15]|nr:hypothetical protein B0H10DRAFT_978311 [Mycena sp. CBHHK59/15]
MPPRPSQDRNSAVLREPLRASVLDVFQQLGALDNDSGIVEWMFPEFHEEKERERSRVKLPEPVEVPLNLSELEEPIRKSRPSRFFNIRSRSRSKSRAKRDPPSSSPNVRKDAEVPATPPPISHPTKQTATSPAQATDPKIRKPSLFSRRMAAPGQSLDQPRPSLSDEEWQQITMTGSIADYETNPFLGTNPHTNSVDDARTAKRDGLQKQFSRFTSSFTRSTPTSPVREHSVYPQSDPSTPTGPAPPMPVSPTTGASTSSLPTAPVSPASIQEAPREPAPIDIKRTSQIDHVRKSLSDISEGEVSESSTLSSRIVRRSSSTFRDSM